MNKKIIFFDIDSTLVSHVGKSHIPEATIQAINALVKNGHVIAIATARNLAFTRKIAEFFNIDLLVCCNGAHVTRFSTGNIYETHFDGEFIRIFKTEAFAISEYSYALDAEHVYFDIKQEIFDSVMDELKEVKNIKNTDVNYINKINKKLNTLESAQSAYLFSKLPVSWRIACEKSGNIKTLEFPSYTEFRPLNTSKWSGIMRAAENTGFGLDDIITVGDGLNDIEMIKNASLGIAVGSAQNSLKEVADIVARDIDDNGIFHVFRSLEMI